MLMLHLKARIVIFCLNLFIAKLKLEDTIMDGCRFPQSRYSI